jgi:hypothetical protein
MSNPTNPPIVPPQARFFQWMLGFSSMMVSHALVKAGVIAQLGEQPQTVDALASACGVHREVLFRALRFARAVDIIAQEGDHYVLTVLGRILLRDTPGSLYNAILLAAGEPWTRSWQNFAYSLATGESAFGHVMGAPFFDYLEQHHEFGLPFHQQGSAMSQVTDPAIVAVFDFTRFLTVCDIGGGEGMFLKAILQANPHLRGILYDQTSVVQKHVLGELSGRIEIVAGNFFESVPAADLLILKAVLHDWPDEKCDLILEQCRRAMQPASRLMIVDRVMDEPVDAMNAFYDLHMQVVLQGRERTEAEFSTLLQNAGMELLRIIPTASPVIPLRIIEASLKS